MTAYLHLPVKIEHPDGGVYAKRWEWVRADQIVAVYLDVKPKREQPGTFEWPGPVAELVTGRRLHLLCSENDAMALLFHSGHDLAIPDHADLHDPDPDWAPGELLEHLAGFDGAPPVLYAQHEAREATDEPLIHAYGDRMDAYDPDEEPGAEATPADEAADDGDD